MCSRKDHYVIWHYYITIIFMLSFHSWCCLQMKLKNTNKIITQSYLHFHISNNFRKLFQHFRYLAIVQIYVVEYLRMNDTIYLPYGSVNINDIHRKRKRIMRCVLIGHREHMNMYYFLFLNRNMYIYFSCMIINIIQYEIPNVFLMCRMISFITLHSHKHFQ